MLERQQAQLIAGVQGLHQMNQNDERLSAEPLETNKNSQPLVHQILQRLGVLEPDDPWDEVEPEIGDVESQLTEPDAASDPMSPQERQYLWPSVANNNNNGIPQAWEDVKDLTMGLPVTGNGAHCPLTASPFYQFFSAENLQSFKASGPLATDFTNGGLPNRSCFEPVAMVEPMLGPFIQPYSNCSTADANRFSYSNMNHTSQSNPGRLFGGEDMASPHEGAADSFFYR